jgi:putative membrane protein insertion efficiency factor
MNVMRFLPGPRASRPQTPRTRRGSRGWRFASLRSIGWDWARFIVRLPANVFLLLIRIYQRTLSPVLPAIFGSACGCRFAPSCSHYAAEAIRTHGAIVGVLLAAIRLVKCTPLHPGGFDPVPPRRTRPRCERFAA